MDKKKVLIYGLYDWCNLGDDLMMYEINKKITNENISPFFIRNDDDNYFSFKKKYDKNLFLNKKVKQKFFNKILKYYELIKLCFKRVDYDALIFMGGGYINRSIGSGYGRLIYIYLLKTIFMFKGKKVYFTGQTVGPINNKLEKLIIKKIYNKADVAVRESKSEAILNDLNINNKLVGDDAYLSYFNASKKDVVDKFIIVNYKDFVGYENIKGEFENFLIEVYKKTKFKIVLVPFRKGNKYNEYKIHKYFLKNLTIRGVKAELFETNNITELNDKFSTCEFVIATAYHAVVLGLKNNKKVYTGFIGDYYQTKIEGITNFYDSSCYELYNLANKKSFCKYLDKIDLYNIDSKNISLKIHNNVLNNWNRILKEINDEHGK